MGDKKKTIILGALGALLLAVGAFQLLGSGSPSVPKAKPAQKTQAATSATQVAVAAEPDLPSRDPFQAVASDLPKQAPPPTTIQPKAFKPMPSITGRIRPLPIVGPNGITSGVGSSGPASQPANQFGYSLSGVVVGNKPAAVFSDANGGERLVQQGESIDGTARVVSIKSGEVIINYRGKTLRLTTGEKSNEN